MASASQGVAMTTRAMEVAIAKSENMTFKRASGKPKSSCWMSWENRLRILPAAVFSD
jgi:hypothetical protein